MGCFNSTGFLSRTPILYGDRVVCIIGIQNREIHGHELYYPDSMVRPFFLPIRGVYDDYGSIENVDRTPIVDMIERCAGQSVEDLCRGIERCLYGLTIQGNIAYWESSKKEQDMYKKLVEFFQVPYVIPDGAYVTPVLLFEHEDIYDKMFPTKDFDGEYRLDKLHAYVYELEKLYEKHKKRIDKDENVLATMTKSIPSIVQSSSFARPIDFMFAGDDKIWKEVKEIEEKTGFVESPYVMSNANWVTFSMYNKLTLQERFTVYKECIDEVRRMVAMWYFYLGTPMFISFSKTAGEQWFNLKDLETLNKLIAEKIVEINDKYENDELDDSDGQYDFGEGLIVHDGPENGGGA